MTTKYYYISCSCDVAIPEVCSISSDSNNIIALMISSLLLSLSLFRRNLHTQYHYFQIDREYYIYVCFKFLSVESECPLKS